MAKKPKATEVNLLVLNAVNDAMNKEPGYLYLGPADRAPLVNRTPPLIQVNETLADPNDANSFAVRLTPEGIDYISKPLTTNAAIKPFVKSEGVKMDFEISSGAVLPEPKRGKPAGSGTSKYPFDKLEVGQGFFVPDGDKPATKTLGALVSNYNMKGATPTGENKTVKVGRRDPNDKTKFITGPDGKKVYDEVTKPVLKAARKLVVRSVEPGQQYGSVGPFPSKGAYVLRQE